MDTNIIDLERTLKEAAHAKFSAAITVGSTMLRTEVIERTCKEAEQCARIAAATLLGAAVTSACVVTTVTQPLVGLGETVFETAKAVWRA